MTCEKAKGTAAPFVLSSVPQVIDDDLMTRLLFLNVFLFLSLFVPFLRNDDLILPFLGACFQLFKRVSVVWILMQVTF